VTTVEMNPRDARASVPASACVPAPAARIVAAATTQGYLLGLPAVGGLGRCFAPMSRLTKATSLSTDKIHNYMSTTHATGEGMTMSIGRDRMLGAERANRELPTLVQVDMVKGGDARGIPPRGRPV
jgi:hypothetical protein